MDWITRLNAAVDHIESHLQDEPIDYDTPARITASSVYLFQRVFSTMAGMPLSVYVRRRRLTLAAYALQHSGAKVIDVALQFGYQSPEAFARAFSAFHGVPPSAARKTGTQLQSCARIAFHIHTVGGTLMHYRIESLPAHQLYGIQTLINRNDEDGGEGSISRFWQEKWQDDSCERLLASSGLTKDNAAVNAICNYADIDSPAYPYLLCIPLTKASDPSGFTIVDVPASAWAVFRTSIHSIEETSAAIAGLHRQIYAEWLPTSGCSLVSGYEQERYYHDAGGHYEECWLRIVTK